MRYALAHEEFCSDQVAAVEQCPLLLSSVQLIA